MKTFIYTFAAISMVSVSTVFSGVIYKDKYGKHRFPENDIFSIFIKYNRENETYNFSKRNVQFSHFFAPCFTIV